MAGIGVPVVVALGSNLGDRDAALRRAVGHLRTLIADLSYSTFIDTAPVGVGPQPRFLNAAVAGTTTLGLRDFFNALRRIEAEGGRERAFPGSPRTIDVDLILFGTDIVDEADLQVPHPRFRERRFVLEPVAEVAPAFVDPVTGLSMIQLLGRLEPDGL